MDADTVIVGGGPGGLSAAFFLSAGRTVVIERLSGDRFDRYHSVCGEGISEDAFADLRPMGPWHIRNRISGTRLVWPDGTQVYMGCRGYIIDRPRFLAELRSRCAEAGTGFMDARVTDIRETGEGFLVTVSDGRVLRCANVIGADGAFSTVRKRLFGSRPERCIAVERHITERNTPDELIVHMDERYRGTYRWVFPSGSGSNIGFAKGLDTADGCGNGAARYIPFGGVGRIVSGNAYLVGDAAGMPNPVSFGGLRAAMLSGRRAAEAVMAGDPEGYQRWWDRSILSSERFMRFHGTLKEWTNDDMERAVRPFRSGRIVVPALWAALTRPWNIGMYIGCLFAFKFTW